MQTFSSRHDDKSHRGRDDVINHSLIRDRYASPLSCSSHPWDQAPKRAERTTVPTVLTLGVIQLGYRRSGCILAVTARAGVPPGCEKLLTNFPCGRFGDQV